MSDHAIADALVLLGQGMSIKDVAETLAVSQWDVANLIRPCRRTRHART